MGSGSGRLNSVERLILDTSVPTWESLKPMHVARIGHGAACLDGCLIACGGENLSSAESYDPKANQWKALPSMSHKRFGAACTTVLGRVYVIGGKLNRLQNLN